MSSSDLAISVRGLSKAYTITHEQNKHSTLAEALLARARNPLRRSRKDTFWALQDISLDIKKGDVVGIVGRNGAGKSTFLKILSRITEPTSGEIELYGRVGSLLEVGTGFHPELTGRENIFLNGAILGMSKAEIRTQFDAIVDFAEIEKFLDTPVKRYSSGMYVRLAFAVAAHLSPEILIVDEVLAVGDVTFQKKCLAKMESVGASGRTVLFVSHSMPTISRLCTAGVFLSAGKVQHVGEVGQVTRMYLHYEGQKASERLWNDSRTAPGDVCARLRAVRVLDQSERCADHVSIGESSTIEVEYEQLRSDLSRPLTVSIHVINEAGITLFASNDFNNMGWYTAPRKSGTVRARCIIPPNLLTEGTYAVLVAVCSYNPNVIHAIERDAVVFQAVESETQVGARAEYGGDWPGVIRPFLVWEAAYVS